MFSEMLVALEAVSAAEAQKREEVRVFLKELDDYVRPHGDGLRKENWNTNTERIKKENWHDTRPLA